MNPFTRNPFEIADEAGLRLAKRGIEVAYRHLDISPVLSRHAPRIAFSLGFTITAIVGPAEKAFILPAAAAFMIIAVARIMPDASFIRTAWNADLYRRFSLIAMREREHRTYRWLMIALIANVATTCAALLSSFGASIALQGGLLHGAAIPSRLRTLGIRHEWLNCRFLQ